jgi:hypothetical protein
VDVPGAAGALWAATADRKVGAYYFKQYSNDIASVQFIPPTPGMQGDSDKDVVDNRSWAVLTQWTFNITGRWLE